MNRSAFVGAGRVRPGEAMAELPVDTRLRSGVTCRRRVVGEHATDGDAAAGNQSAHSQKRGAGARWERRLRHTHARRIINRDVDVVADADVSPTGPMNAVADRIRLSGCVGARDRRRWPLVALNHRRRVQRPRFRPRGATPRDGRPGHADARADLPRGRALPPIGQDGGGARHVESAGLAMRTRRCVLESPIALARALDPLGDGAHAIPAAAAAAACVQPGESRVQSAADASSAWFGVTMKHSEASRDIGLAWQRIVSRD